MSPDNCVRVPSVGGSLVVELMSLDNLVLGASAGRGHVTFDLT